MAEWNELHKSITVDEPHEHVVEFVKKYLKPGMRILDHGCGKGRHSLYCAQRGFEVHAVDNAENALSVLRKDVEKDQLFEKLKVTNADIGEMPFPDGYFDAIISVQVINHGYWKDVKGFFEEADRVLKQGGLFFILGVPIEFLEDVKGPKTREVEKGTYLELRIPDHDVPHHLFSQEELRRLLGGYDIIRLENIREYSEWTKQDVAHFLVIARKK